MQLCGTAHSHNESAEPAMEGSLVSGLAGWQVLVQQERHQFLWHLREVRWVWVVRTSPAVGESE